MAFTEQEIASETNWCVNVLTQKIEDGSIPLSPEYGDIFYAVGQFNKNILRKITDASKDDKFWLEEGSEWINNWIFEKPHLLWYLLKLECENAQICKDFIDDFKRDQTIEGKIFLNEDSHVNSLRVLSFVEPESITTKNAVNYFLQNWKSFEAENLAIGILALSEINYYEYQDTILEICQQLLKQQQTDGYFGDIYDFKDKIPDLSRSFLHIPYNKTAYITIALARFIGPEHEAVVKGIRWLIENKENSLGVLSNFYHRLALLLMNLISIGGGPKISLADYEWKQLLQKQQVDFMRPYFIHTSPIFESRIQVKELYERISENIKSGKEKIRICSLFIDILYEDIINLAENNPNLEFQIITRPSKDIKGFREKIARNVLQLLNTATKGNLRTSEFVHCRMIIVDENTLIVSSADLTRDQLYDEFNAGIYTRDKETIRKGISFFNNIWEQSEKL